MARYMREETTKIYRVVLLSKFGHKSYYGPYEFPQSAGYVKSYMTNHHSNIVDSWVESTEPAWERHG